MSTGVMRSGSQLLWLQYKNTRRKKYKVTAISTANLEYDDVSILFSSI